MFLEKVMFLEEGFSFLVTSVVLDTLEALGLGGLVLQSIPPSLSKLFSLSLFFAKSKVSFLGLKSKQGVLIAPNEKLDSRPPAGVARESKMPPGVSPLEVVPVGRACQNCLLPPVIGETAQEVKVIAWLGLRRP